jgi:hypothetical protein
MTAVQADVCTYTYSCTKDKLIQIYPRFHGGYRALSAMGTGGKVVVLPQLER